MNKAVFQYKDKDGKATIQTRILDKSRKGTYKWDLIELDVSGSFDKEHHILVMTTKEAEIVALGLLQAIVIRRKDMRKVRRKIRKR